MDTSPFSNYVMHPFWNQFVKVSINMVERWSEVKLICCWPLLLGPT